MRPVLTHGVVDGLMAGGLSLLAFGFCQIYFNPIAMQAYGLSPAPVLSGFSRWAFWLSFAVNFPHFLITYQLLYGDYLRQHGYNSDFLFAGIALPTLLLAALGLVLFLDPGSLALFIQFMFLTVSWHYVRQVYGVVLVCSARAGVFYHVWERRVLNFTLLLLGVASMFFMYEQADNPNFSGVAMERVVFPPVMVPVFTGLMWISTLAMLAMFARKFVLERTAPPPTAWVAMVALWVWYVPGVIDSYTSMLVPLSHCLQYLWLVWAFRWNKVQAESSGVRGERKRGYVMKNFWGYVLLSMLLGSAFFHFVPNFLDGQRLLIHPALGMTPFLAAFAAFINIHHFFIDAVLWRKGNVEVKKYLVDSPTALTSFPI